MPFGPRSLASVETALFSTGTTEGAFRTAVVDVARQVDANEVDTNADREIAITGAVASTATVTFNNGDDASRNISIDTTQQTNSVGTDAIIDDAITNDKILANAVTNESIALGTIMGDRIANDQILSAQLNTLAKQRLRILPAGGGTPLFQIDGFRVLP